jgi:hypothetical protein
MILRRLDRAGYLTPMPSEFPPRTTDEKEDVFETKYGVSDWRVA